MDKNKSKLIISSNKKFYVILSIVFAFIQFFIFIFSQNQLISMPIWAIIIYLTILFYLIYLLLNINKNVEFQEFPFDRKFELISVVWNYDVNDDYKTLKGYYIGERKLTCVKGTIEYIGISLSPAENLVPFDPNLDYNPEILNYMYDGEVKISGPHRKNDSNFAFRINFYPALKKDDSVYVKFKYNMPRYKISTIEYLREATLNAQLEGKLFEFSTFNIKHPTDKFVFELNFTSNCCILPKTPEVVRWGDVYEKEMQELSKIYSSTKDANDNWKLRFEKYNPPIKTKYKIRWDPARKAQLEEKIEHRELMLK